MATPQEVYDETKTSLDLNIAKLQVLQREIQEKQRRDQQEEQNKEQKRIKKESNLLFN